MQAATLTLKRIGRAMASAKRWRTELGPDVDLLVSAPGPAPGGVMRDDAPSGSTARQLHSACTGHRPRLWPMEHDGQGMHSALGL